MVSKAIRNTTKTAIKHGKGHIPSTGNEYLDGAVSTAADVAENQLDADPHASAKDRLKMAGGDVISGVADTVDNPVVTVAANVAKVSEMCGKHVLTNDCLWHIYIHKYKQSISAESIVGLFIGKW